MNTVQSDTFIRYLDQLKYCRQDSRYSYNGTVLNCIVPFFHTIYLQGQLVYHSINFYKIKQKNLCKVTNFFGTYRICD